MPAKGGQPRPLFDPLYQRYCPRHEWDWWECCACCTTARKQLRQADSALRKYWFDRGYSFLKRRKVA